MLPCTRADRRCARSFARLEQREERRAAARERAALWADDRAPRATEGARRLARWRMEDGAVPGGDLKRAPGTDARSTRVPQAVRLPQGCEKVFGDH